jgi:excisionase family DNA binding protein
MNERKLTFTERELSGIVQRVIMDVLPVVSARQDLLTIDEFSKLVKHDYKTIYNWIMEGKIKAFQTSCRSWRIRWDEYQRFVDACEEKSREEIFNQGGA